MTIFIEVWTRTDVASAIDTTSSDCCIAQPVQNDVIDGNVAENTLENKDIAIFD